MKGLLSLVKVLTLESFRSPFDMMMIFFLPILLFFLVEGTASSVPEVTFKANFDLPSWVKTSDNPDAELFLKNNKLTVKVISQDPAKIGYIKGLVMKIVSNLEGTKPAFEIVEVNVREYSEKEFLLAGYIAMILLSSGMLTAVRSISYYREKQLLKLIKSLPIPKISIVSFPLPGLVTSFLATVLMLIVGNLLGATLHSSWMFVFALFGGILIAFLFGSVIALSIKSTRGAQGFAATFYVIAPFFSGMYFPVDFLPKYLQKISPFLPSTWIVNIIRKSLGM